MNPGDESALSRSQTSPGWSGMASYGALLPSLDTFEGAGLISILKKYGFKNRF